MHGQLVVTDLDHIRLEEELGLRDYQPLNNNPIIALAGYSGDLNDGRFLSLHWGCTTSGIVDDLLWHTCKRYRGASGSPVLMLDEWDGKPRLRAIGVHVGVIGDVPIAVPAKTFEGRLGELEESLIERDFGGDLFKRLTEGPQLRTEHVKTMLLGKRM